MNQTWMYDRLIVFALVIAFGAFWLAYKYYRITKPDKVLSDVDKIIKDANTPNYIAVQTLKEALRYNPEHKGLNDKLNEIDIDTTEKEIINNSTTKTLYVILVIIIGIMGFIQIYFWSEDKPNFYDLITGIFFIKVSLIIYQQYLKKK